MIDSLIGTITVDEPVYVSNEPESWGQPAAVRYIFVSDGQKMYGQLISGSYVSSRPGIPTEDLSTYEEELENALLVDSGILPRLIEQARQESPSLDWERDLNEL